MKAVYYKYRTVKQREWLPYRHTTLTSQDFHNLRETKLEDVGCHLVLQTESGFSLIFLKQAEALE